MKTRNDSKRKTKHCLFVTFVHLTLLFGLLDSPNFLITVCIPPRDETLGFLHVSSGVKTFYLRESLLQEIVTLTSNGNW